MTDKKNPQEQTVTFQRRNPAGEWETTDAKGKKIEQRAAPSEPATTGRKSAKAGDTQKASQPTKNTGTSSTDQGDAAKTPSLRTGPLPRNTVGYGKLAAIQPPVETYEQLREATDEQLTAANLDAEQVAKLREVQAQLAKA